jgi:cytochrome P450
MTPTFTRPAQGIRRPPPGPKGLPLLGNLLDFSRDVLRCYCDWSTRFGDVVALRLGSWPAVLINRPADIEHVLVANHRNFIKFPFFFRHVRAIFGAGLLTSEGALWQSQRRLMAPAFNPQRLTAYGDATVRYTEEMLDEWQADEVRDAHADAMALTLRIAAKSLFDAEVRDDVAELGDAFQTIADEIAVRMRRPLRIPDALPTPGNIRYARAVRRIDRLVGRIIGERRNHGGDRGDLLSMLVLARDDEDRPMIARQLRDEMVTLLLAGHETTALALSWTWYLLSQHPDVEEMLADEATRVLGGRAAGASDLPKLVVARQIVTEAMRLYPPAWGFGREALVDCELGGYCIPAGTTIIISPWVLHRDPRYFDRPAEFRPERWSDEFMRRLPRSAYIPFGGGPRICIGNRFAVMEAVLILATVARRYRLQWQGNRPILPLPSITLRPQGGVWVKPAQRFQS